MGLDSAYCLELRGTMHRRHQLRNLPTEVLRTIVAVVDTGSYTKAAATLGLTQPAITAQVQRLTSILGDEVFDRSATGLVLTSWGSIVLDHARQLLAINDQIIALSAGTALRDVPRIGISVAYARSFLEIFAACPATERIALICESSDEITKRLADGRLDVGCVFEPAAEARPISRWVQPLEWCRGASLVLVPDQPVPLVVWPGHIVDRIAIGALEDAGLAYTLRLASSDLGARVAATAAGLGVMPFLKKFGDDRLLPVSSRSLPALRSLGAGLCVRPGFDIERVGAVVEAIRMMVSVLDPPVDLTRALAS